MSRITLLKVLHNTKGMKIMVEAPSMTTQTLIQSPLAGMAKRWMPNIVDQSQRLSQILVQAKLSRGSASDLRDLDRMGQATTEVVRRAAGEDLRLTGKTAEGTGPHNTFPVALERRTRRTGRSGIHANPKRIPGPSGNRTAMQIDRHGLLPV